MNSRQHKKIIGTRLWIWFVFLIATSAGCKGEAREDSNDDIISIIEFQKIRDSFPQGACNIDYFLSKSAALGFNPVWYDYDQPEERSLFELKNEEICLIVLSSTFEAYFTTRELDGSVKSRKSVGPENFFPTKKPVTDFDFFLPSHLVPKKCLTYEGPSVPYVISFEKRQKKLTRRIIKTEANETCFMSIANKKGLIQK